MINDTLIHTFPFLDNYGGFIHISNAFRLQSCLCDKIYINYETGDDEVQLGDLSSPSDKITLALKVILFLL